MAFEQQQQYQWKYIYTKTNTIKAMLEIIIIFSFL